MHTLVNMLWHVYNNLFGFTFTTVNAELSATRAMYDSISNFMGEEKYQEDWWMKSVVLVFSRLAVEICKQHNWTFPQ